MEDVEQRILCIVADCHNGGKDVDLTGGAVDNVIDELLRWSWGRCSRYVDGFPIITSCIAKLLPSFVRRTPVAEILLTVRLP